ncbi:MAG: DUF2284 domain-containing protein [Clostridiales bacterium]|jgi:predicted metal-binding protein|nr:DUF2284 domain-containing protein [Eubacteriales bacterium]MDH7565616.1 DUF2284 domain-containing protein [Clostridiales bacterium]
MKDYFVEKALSLGADHAVVFNISDIEFDPRTILKCMFGCSDWGKGHTCPSRPNSPSVAEKTSSKTGIRRFLSNNTGIYLKVF